MSIASRYGRYTRYRPTFVPWIGEIPLDWKVIRTKHAARVASGHTPSRSVREYWENCTIPWFTLADVWQIRDDRQKYIDQTKEKISQLGLDNSAARLLPAGTVILSRTASVGFSGILSQPMATTQDFVNWVPGRSITSEYLLYVFRTMRGELRRLTMGSTHQTIYMPDVLQFSTPLPSIAEQRCISKFLDRETVKIDALIQKKQRLIELLDEKRAALISHAVTKGLDPSVAMRQSGVEWIGEIPAHWSVKKVWMMFELGRGRVISHEEIHQHSGPYPVYSSQTLNRGMMGSMDTYDFNGDYLTWTTDGAYAGTVFRRSGKFNCTNVCGTLSPRGLVDLDFMRHAINLATSWFVRHDINPKLMNNVMASIQVQVPAIDEQERICSRIRTISQTMRPLVEAVTTVISRLQEYRAALISAAVTGQIDVRDEV